MINSKDFLNELSKYKRLSHHPDCDRYSHHLVRLFGHPICLGCFFMCIGIISGSLMYLSFLKYITGPQLYMMGITVYIPTTVQFKIQHKIFKSISRFMLGIGIIMLLGSLFRQNWGESEYILKLLSICVFLIVLRATLKIRNRFVDNPCSKCNQGKYPLCYHKLPDMKRLKNQIPNSEFSKFVDMTIMQLENPSESIIEFVTI